MQLPSIEEEVGKVREIKRMEKNIQPSPDQWKPIRDVASKYLDTLFTAYSQSSGDARVLLAGRINNFIQNLPSPVQPLFFDKFHTIQAQLDAEKSPGFRLKRMGIQEVQQEVAREVWNAAPSKQLGQQDVTQIVKSKLDTPEFRGLKLCLRAATGTVPAEEWFADLPKESDFAANDQEMQKLIRELRENNDDVVVLIIGAVTNASESAPLFLFNNFAPFKDKKATIILVTGTYSDWSKQVQDKLAENIGKIINETTTIKNNEITFDKNSKYSNISMKFFGTLIPDNYLKDYKHHFYDYWRRFCQKQINARKNIFIGWVADAYCANPSVGLVKVYKEIKDRYPDNMFFYGKASTGSANHFIIFDPLERFKPNKPLAQRFFSINFYKSCIKAFDFSKISKIVQLKKPFLLCNDLNFTFVKNNNELIVSLDDNYLSRAWCSFYWGLYIEDRTDWVDAFIKKLKNVVGEKQAAVELKKLGMAVEVDAEPTMWREAVEKSGFMSWNEYQSMVPN